MEDRVITVLSDFVSRSPARYDTILPSLMAIDTAAVEIYSFNLSLDLARPGD